MIREERKREMKKLGKGKRVHPAPPSSSPWDFLAALPAAMLTLAAALSPEEKEVLVYLLSGGDAGFVADKDLGKKKPQQTPHNQHKSHPPELGCSCFGCYKSFWARWNDSPNNHLIHHILDAVEESLESQSLPAARRRGRRCRRKDYADVSSPTAAAAAVKASNHADGYGFDDEDAGEEDDEFGRSREVSGGDDRSPVRRLVSFIGDRVWGVWNY